MGRSRESNKVVIEITQVRDDGFFYQDGGVEGGKKQSYLSYIQKEELLGFADGMKVREKEAL